MYSYNDFERLFVRYKAEAVPAGISIESFCHSNKVPYNLFSKWYKDTRHKIVPVSFRYLQLRNSCSGCHGERSDSLFHSFFLGTSYSG